jgi:(5-formylfuran-3-yl)methyl phosphate synthase
VSRVSRDSCSLLVSVRSVAEAEAALAGGADVIDVKEPANGSLGRAADSVIGDIVSHVSGRRPISVALGELCEPGPLPSLACISFVKWGLSRIGKDADWPDRWREARKAVARENPSCQLVAVAYADWEAANAPDVDSVCRLACNSAGVFLIDTFTKHIGRTLLDYLCPEALDSLCRRCRKAGVRVALAGSLKIEQLPTLMECRPDLIAVRGAVCTGGRNGQVDVNLVRGVADRIHAPFVSHRGSWIVA